MSLTLTAQRKGIGTGMIETKFLNNNDCYTKPTKIKPQYIIVHSTACGYRDKDQLYNNWNKSGKLSVHGMVDDKGGYYTLPLNYLGWHVGSRGNSKTVGFETCEPKNIAYANANHTKVDTTIYNPTDPQVRADFEKRYNNAVEMAAFMARETGIPVDHIVSHKEGWKLGIASNHGDPDQWWLLFGKTMDGFRRDVNKKLTEKPKKPNPQTGGDSIVYRVQCGAFSNRNRANALKDKLKEAGFSAIVKKDRLLYRVQCGVFNTKGYALQLAAKLKSAGFDAYVFAKNDTTI